MELSDSRMHSHHRIRHVDRDQRGFSHAECGDGASDRAAFEGRLRLDAGRHCDHDLLGSVAVFFRSRDVLPQLGVSDQDGLPLLAIVFNYTIHGYIDPPLEKLHAQSTPTPNLGAQQSTRRQGPGSGRDVCHAQNQ